MEIHFRPILPVHVEDFGFALGASEFRFHG
jgi:hypothetical protein